MAEGEAGCPDDHQPRGGRDVSKRGLEEDDSFGRAWPDPKNSIFVEMEQSKELDFGTLCETQDRN